LPSTNRTGHHYRAVHNTRAIIAAAGIVGSPAGRRTVTSWSYRLVESHVIRGEATTVVWQSGEGKSSMRELPRSFRMSFELKVCSFSPASSPASLLRPPLPHHPIPKSTASIFNCYPSCPRKFNCFINSYLLVRHNFQLTSTIVGLDSQILDNPAPSQQPALRLSDLPLGAVA
jgi:hypothetical protein